MRKSSGVEVEGKVLNSQVVLGIRIRLLGAEMSEEKEEGQETGKRNLMYVPG